jgi:hypothetical protein
MNECFSCDPAKQDWALDRLGDLLDAEVPPSWIIEKMIQVISLPLHLDPSEIEQSDLPELEGPPTVEPA